MAVDDYIQCMAVDDYIQCMAVDDYIKCMAVDDFIECMAVDVHSRHGNAEPLMLISCQSHVMGS